MIRKIAVHDRTRLGLERLQMLSYGRAHPPPYRPVGTLFQEGPWGRAPPSAWPAARDVLRRPSEPVARPRAGLGGGSRGPERKGPEEINVETNQ